MATTTAILPFLAFANDAADLDTLKAFASSRAWQESAIHQGDIKTATEHLKTNPSPTLLLVEIPSAKEAQGLLDGLAEVCDPDTKVIIIGSVNEYSFYCWLMDIGISSYLLKPLTQEMLENAYAKSQQKPPEQAKLEKPPGKIIAVIGTRGGVGTSTLSLNLAGLIADNAKKNVALIDTDPQEGSIALSLDLEPSRGFREALEKPERIDSLFIERVMTKPHKYLSILSSEESLQEQMNIHEQSADALLKQLRDRFDVVVLDIPRYLSPFGKKCLAQANHVVLVSELTLLSLRDTLRQGDVMREALKLSAPVVVANRVGLASKHEVKLADFEKGINAKVAFSIPYAPDIYMHIGSDIPAIKHKSHASVKALQQLAEHLLPEIKSGAADKNAKEKGKEKESKGSGFFGGKK